MTVSAFIGPSPLVRDLKQSDRGPDVAVLAAYLRDLGYLDPSSVDDRFGPAVKRAVSAFQSERGLPVDGLFKLASVVFVPTDFGSVTDIRAEVGEAIAPGSVLVKGSPSLQSLSMRPASESQTLQAFDDAAVVLESGSGDVLELKSVSPSSDDQVAIAAWLAVHGHEAEGATSSATVDPGAVVFDQLVLYLRDPLRVGVVPSSAVFAGSSGRYCVAVVSEGKARAIFTSATTVSSEIGLVGVDQALIGSLVLRDAKIATREVLDSCE
jgi:peptidoglycan hydrolase-like protein with peptidoglycan-binding domain